MNETTTNARRFIEAYNKIDHAIRAQYDFRRSIPFSDMIRKTASLNSIVRKYEDDLIDFGRLRNAIIHGSDDSQIIAEPHEHVVLEMEKITRLITTPPNALQTVASRNVLTGRADDNILSIIKLLSSSHYSNIPIYRSELLIGIANNGRVLEFLGEAILHGANLEEVVQDTPISKVVEKNGVNFEVMPAKSGVDQVLEKFYYNRKLMVVVITGNGRPNEKPLGIITPSDVIEMNSILDNFN